MKILAIHNNTGSRYYRLIPQLKHMQKQGHKVMLSAHDDEHLMQKIEWCDILVLQMVFSRTLTEHAKRLGKRVIFECDDLIHTVPKTHYSYDETKGWRKLQWLYRIWRVMRLCDGFIGTTKGLANVYGRMAKSWLVFPNLLDLSHWLKEEKKNTTDTIRILWAGSTSHTGDLNWVKPIMDEILRKYPHVRFIYIGHGGIPTDDLYAKFIYGDDIFDGLDTSRRESMLPVPANVWPYILPALQADIAIAPLERNYFNGFKSQCKYLEYAVNGIPGVYAGWHYKDVKHGVTGLLADTKGEWIRALSSLIENGTMRMEMGKMARDSVIRDFNAAPYLEDWSRFVLG